MAFSRGPPGHGGPPYHHPHLQQRGPNPPTPVPPHLAPQRYAPPNMSQPWIPQHENMSYPQSFTPEQQLPYNTYPFPAGMPAQDVMPPPPQQFPFQQMYISAPFVGSGPIWQAAPTQAQVMAPVVPNTDMSPRKLAFNSKENIVTCSRCGHKNILWATEMEKRDEIAENLRKETCALEAKIVELEAEIDCLKSGMVNVEKEEESVKTEIAVVVNQEESVHTELSPNAAEFNMPKCRMPSNTTVADEVPIVSAKGMDDERENTSVLEMEAYTQVEENLLEEVPEVLTTYQTESSNEHKNVENWNDEVERAEKEETKPQVDVQTVTTQVADDEWNETTPTVPPENWRAEAGMRGGGGHHYDTHRNRPRQNRQDYPRFNNRGGNNQNRGSGHRGRYHNQHQQYDHESHENRPDNYRQDNYGQNQGQHPRIPQGDMRQFENNRPPYPDRPHFDNRSGPHRGSHNNFQGHYQSRDNSNNNYPGHNQHHSRDRDQRPPRRNNGRPYGNQRYDRNNHQQDDGHEISSKVRGSGDEKENEKKVLLIRDKTNEEEKPHDQVNNKNLQNEIVKIKQGDLFLAPGDFALAHCVGQDFRMGMGIAVKFRTEFQRVGELLDQNVRVGGCAHLNVNGRYIFYLVTKEFSVGKPKLEDLQSCLRAMKTKCQRFGVKKLAMPRIGCGLDKLDWGRVRAAINETFCDANMEIEIYDFNVEKLPESEGFRAENQMKVKYNHDFKLADIESGTALLFLGTENGYMDQTAKSLDKKLHFEKDYKNEEKTVGSVWAFRKPANYDWVFGLIVAKTENEEIKFSNLEACCGKLSQMLRKDGFKFVGIEFPHEWSSDKTFFEKILALLRTCLPKTFELWVCFPNAEMDYSREALPKRDNAK